jgi:hypothetical protein
VDHDGRWLKIGCLYFSILLYTPNEKADLQIRPGKFRLVREAAFKALLSLFFLNHGFTNVRGMHFKWNIASSGLSKIKIRNEFDDAMPLRKSY